MPHLNQPSQYWVITLDLLKSHIVEAENSSQIPDRVIQTYVVTQVALPFRLFNREEIERQLINYEGKFLKPHQLIQQLSGELSDEYCQRLQKNAVRKMVRLDKNYYESGVGFSKGAVPFETLDMAVMAIYKVWSFYLDSKQKTRLSLSSYPRASLEELFRTLTLH